MSYGINDIEHLEFREGVRQKISMYLGSDDTEGIYQAFKEIVNNSTDEALMGYGNQIDITVDEETNCVSIRDYGRGVPFGIRDNGENVLVSIYTTSHTGGKFGKGAYKNSSGLNGIGGSAVCLSSKIFEVISFRDGKNARLNVCEGNVVDYTEGTTTEDNGTYVRFTPDKTVFKNMNEHYSFERICSEIQNLAYLNKGIKFTVSNFKEMKEFYSKNGIADFINHKAENALMKPIICSAKDDRDEVEVAFMWATGGEQSYVFVNGLFCPEGGAPITGAKTAITSVIKKLSGEDLAPELIRKGLIYAINCKVAEPSFANQTKTKINNPNLRTLASQAFREGLQTFAKSKDCDKILKMLSKFQKAEKAAERARKQVLDTAREIKKNQNKRVFNADKLKDAEFLGEDSTLLIVEGNSAGGAMANARDYKKYGILSLRGKILNPLSNTEERIANNEEIKLILKALNIVPGEYNSKKLRYGKVCICTDSDSDGFHIGLLVMSVLYYFAPEFLFEGRLGWLRSPLYIVKNGKEESYYFTDEEMNAVRGTITGEVQRNKGLGSLSDDQAHRSMFTPEFQRIDTFVLTEESEKLLLELMGDEVAPRKEFIFENVDFSEIRE